MSCEDPVSISDDDNVVEIITKTRKNQNRRKQFSITDTIIVLDDELQCNISDNNNSIIIINDDGNSKPKNNLYTAISKENKLLGEFIKKCLQIENSKGMGRVINKTLIKSYMETSKSYKNSEECMKVIRNALNCLEIGPEYKFSHVKNLSDIFKSKRFKKRVNLTTLATNLKKGNKAESNKFTKSKTIIIDSDEEQEIPIIEKGATIINIDDDPNEVIVLDAPDVPMEADEEKENKKEAINYLVPRVEVSLEPKISSDSIEIIEHKVPDDPTVDLKRVKKIEKQIEYYKNLVVKLEEAEVDDDSTSSPYIRCEMMKAKIVSLYSELCQITGHEAVKRREVRLQVMEGYPVAPIRKLEKFINDNIGGDGEPHFPDFYDVVNCVTASNLEDNLGWSKHQIMKEASALFTQCGRALQKRRQKREWRHLLRRVKTEVDADPADEDPALLARLNANKQLAIRKENDLLERFSVMQNLPKQPSLVVRNNIVEPSNSNKTLQHAEDKTVTETIPNNENHVKKEPDFLETSGPEESRQKSAIQESKSNKPEVKEPGCSVEHETVTEKNEIHVVKEPDFLETRGPKDSVDKSIIQESKSDKPEVKEPAHSVVNEPTLPDTPSIINGTDTALDINIKVKMEKDPIDVVSQLEQLGENFTISIADIEDPFLVIEVSSDSSCDET